MGGKYQIRTTEETEFSRWTDYYIDNFYEFIKLYLNKRSKIIFITIRRD